MIKWSDTLRRPFSELFHVVRCRSKAREVSGDFWDSSLNGPDVKFRELTPLICSPVGGVPCLEADANSCKMQ